ncbi:MAG: hypothetical protein WEB59_16110 [Thermoanaerobaculia bacterium]
MTSSEKKTLNSVVVFQSLVLCDDIRHENNGKLLFVGVYSDVVQVARLPAQLRSFALAIQARVFANDRFPFSVSVKDPQGNALLDANGELNYEGEQGRVIWLPLVMGPALLTTEGSYSVQIVLGDSAPIRESFLVRKASSPEVRVTAATPN